MSELKGYSDNHPDETCQFCGKVYPGENDVEFESWWAATECEHMCCLDCSDWTGGFPLCPQCAKEEKERNGQAN
jgi:hypothetical protein